LPGKNWNPNARKTFSSVLQWTGVMRGISFGDYRQMPFDADSIRAQPLSLLVTIATLRQKLFKRAY